MIETRQCIVGSALYVDIGVPLYKLPVLYCCRPGRAGYYSNSCLGLGGL